MLSIGIPHNFVKELRMSSNIKDIKDVKDETHIQRGTKGKVLFNG